MNGFSLHIEPPSYVHVNLPKNCDIVVNPQKTPQILLRSNTQLLLTTMVQQQEVNVAMTSMTS